MSMRDNRDLTAAARNCCFQAIGLTLAALGLVSCGGGNHVSATNSPMPSDAVSVAVAKATRKTLEQHLTVSSELVPFQEISVYAKESGFVKELDVDYGSHVKGRPSDGGPGDSGAPTPITSG